MDLGIEEPGDLDDRPATQRECVERAESETWAFRIPLVAGERQLPARPHLLRRHRSARHHHLATPIKRHTLAASTGSPRANIRGTSAPSQMEAEQNARVNGRMFSIRDLASRAAVITLVKKHPTYRLTGVIEPGNVCY